MSPTWISVPSRRDGVSRGTGSTPRRFVLLVEIAAGTIARILLDGTKTTVARPGHGPNGAGIGPDGKCYVCNNGGFEWHVEGTRRRPTGRAKDYAGGRIERIDLDIGTVECLYRTAGELPLKGPNDLVFDAQGGFYFTDLGKLRARDMDRGAVYYAKADGSFIAEVVFLMVTPNGIGLSPDEKTLYVAQTEARGSGPSTLSSVASSGNNPGRRRMAVVSSPGVGGCQRFDSLALDAEGRICVATLINGGITVISPDGRHVEHHPITTNLCFGGPDL